LNLKAKGAKPQWLRRPNPASPSQRIAAFAHGRTRMPPNLLQPEKAFCLEFPHLSILTLRLKRIKIK
jgi:hypothetical protein